MLFLDHDPGGGSPTNDVRHGGAPFPLPETADPDLARLIHSREALENALDHGTALLAALGLPPLPSMRRAMALLDAIDAPGEDLEPSLSGYHSPSALLDGEYDDADREEDDPGEEEPDREDDGTSEPSLGAVESHGCQLAWSRGFDDDREMGDDNGIADMDGLCEQWRTAALPFSVGGYIA